MSVVAKRKNKQKHLYVEQKAGVCGGEPVIIGTRISVSLIVEMERAGTSVDEMVTMYPHITHAQVYDALSYYYDHKKEIDKVIDENREEYWKDKTKGKNWRR